MKIWFDNEGTSVGGRRYYAVIEEIMIDKDGRPVYVAAPEEVVPAAVENAPEDTLIAKVDEIIEQVEAERAQVTEEVTEEVVEQVAEEVTEETVEEVTEVAAEEVVAEPVAEVDETEEQPEEVVVLPVVDDGIAATEVAVKKPAVRSRNFAEKMRDADEVLQDRYDELKNYALRFRKLKSRISKKFDSINQGRFQFVKLSVAGKTLKLYLNMDITTTDPKFHCKDMSDKKTYVTVPVLLRIKSGRAVKYAKRLIDQCAEQHGMLERRKPFVVDAMALIEEALKNRKNPDAESEEELAEVDGATEYVEAAEVAPVASEVVAEEVAVTETENNG